MISRVVDGHSISNFINQDKFWLKGCGHLLKSDKRRPNPNGYWMVA